MHSSRMHTTRSLPYMGLPDRDRLDRDPPLDRDPQWTETLPPLDRDHPRQRPLWIEDPPVNRITDRCKNITFPQLRLRVVINSVCGQGRPHLIPKYIPLTEILE